jgi:hypothetical protein
MPEPRVGAVVVGQPKASPTQLTAQHPMLFHQIRENIALPTIQPTDKNEKHSRKADASSTDAV